MKCFGICAGGFKVSSDGLYLYRLTTRFVRGPVRTAVSDNFIYCNFLVLEGLSEEASAARKLHVEAFVKLVTIFYCLCPAHVSCGQSIDCIWYSMLVDRQYLIL